MKLSDARYWTTNARCSVGYLAFASRNCLRKMQHRFTSICAWIAGESTQWDEVCPWSRQISTVSSFCLQVNGIPGWDPAWDAIQIDPDLGMECENYKWQQNQSYVEIYIQVPEYTSSKQVNCSLACPGLFSFGRVIAMHHNPKAFDAKVSLSMMLNCQCALLQIEVSLSPLQLKVVVQMRPILYGPLYAAIKKEDSLWFLEGRLLTLLLLKHNRRDHYKDGSTNAETFWPAVLSTDPCLKVLNLLLQLYLIILCLQDTMSRLCSPDERFSPPLPSLHCSH